MAIIDETIYGLKGKQVTQTVEAIKENTSDIAGLETTVAGKQDALSVAQLTAVNSGIDTTKVAQIATNVTDIDTIEGKIPAQATSSNQLADKNFVNSSVATNTANYISNNGEPFASLADLQAYSGTLTNNDYAFVVGTDAAGNTTYTRYKYNASTTTWAEEYVLNNSSFTAEQWAAIQSGITAGLVTKLSGIEAGAEVNDIDSISVNGTAVAPDANKNVNIQVPTPPTVVQTTGISTTDVMSQNAVTGMIYADPGTKTKIVIGGGNAITADASVAIGKATSVRGDYAVAIGASSGSQITSAPGGISLGAFSQAAGKGQMDIGLTTAVLSARADYGYNGSAYRLLTGLYDPQSNHDAATKGYVDSVAPVITMTDTDPGEGATLAANHFIAYYE